MRGPERHSDARASWRVSCLYAAPRPSRRAPPGRGPHACRLHRQWALHHCRQRAGRFSGLVRDLPAGNYVYSMWFRLLDGPESNGLAVDLQWLTAQGVPRDYPAAESTTDAIDLGDAWTRVGDAMTLDARWPIDVALQSAFRVD